jgi:hypothetical protein
MRVEIDVESQEEFDLKRGELLQTLAGDHYHIDLEKSIAPKVTTGVKVQDEMIDEWAILFDQTIEKIKADVAEVLK